jgi:hypothetical protein
LKRSAPTLFAFATFFGAARAHAQNDAQIAQSLFDEGRALMEEKRFAEACPKFAESQRLDPGGGTLLNLAVCHEAEGKTATAWLEFREALGIAGRDQRKDRIELATAHIDALAPRLVKVIVVVPDKLRARAPDVMLDLSRLPPAAWGTPVPIDPGEHHLAVLLGGEMTWGRSFVAAEEGRTYTLDVGAAGAPVDPPPLEERRSTAFWILVGTGGVLLATSAITGIAALSANAYVKDNCSDARDFCTVPDAGDAATRARTLAWVSTGTMIGAAAAGVTAFFLPRTRVAVAPRPDGASLVVRFF